MIKVIKGTVGFLICLFLGAEFIKLIAPLVDLKVMAAPLIGVVIFAIGLFWLLEAFFG